jgi:hypothetical protein
VNALQHEQEKKKWESKRSGDFLKKNLATLKHNLDFERRVDASSPRRSSSPPRRTSPQSRLPAPAPAPAPAPEKRRSAPIGSTAEPIALAETGKGDDQGETTAIDHDGSSLDLPFLLSLRRRQDSGHGAARPDRLRGPRPGHGSQGARQARQAGRCEGDLGKGELHAGPEWRVARRRPGLEP